MRIVKGTKGKYDESEQVGCKGTGLLGAKVVRVISKEWVPIYSIIYLYYYIYVEMIWQR